jgi:hypothetical protein
METNHYIAQEGMTYQRKVDGYIMGNELYLGKFIDGTDDVIENYDEIEFLYEELERLETIINSYTEE